VREVGDLTVVLERLKKEHGEEIETAKEAQKRRHDWDDLERSAWAKATKLQHQIELLEGLEK